MKHLIVFTCAVLCSCKAGDNLTIGSQSPSDASRGDDDDIPSRDAPTDSPTTTANDLVLEYQFEDTGSVVTDSSPNHKNGMLTDTSAWTATGRVGRGLKLTGGVPATAYVTLPDGVLTGVDDFTITFWVNLAHVDAWARIYDFGNGLADPANRFMYFTPNGFVGPTNGVMASSYGGSATNEIALTSATQLPTGVWKHVAITGSGGNRTVYIDGYPAVSIANGPAVAPKEMEPMGAASWLGKSRFASDPGLDGTLDEFRIYKRVLSQEQIADLAWPKQDYSYWRFDEGSGAQAKDSSDRAIGTTVGAGVTWTTGKQGGALDFAGGAAAATGPTATLAQNPLATCTNELTVSAWVKLHELQNWARIFDFGTGTTRFIYLAPTDGAGMHFAMVAESGVFDLVTATPPLAADDSWHHVAATVATGGAVTLYVDGAVVGSGVSDKVKPSDFASMTDLWLGKSRFPDPYLHGAVDDLRIGCRALTADEIKNLSHP